MDKDQVLGGGVANAGEVVRRGEYILRPSNRYSTSIHEFLRALNATGFHGAPVPEGIDADGRERLRFIEGDVATPPYPDWAQTSDALGSVAILMRQFHEASAKVDVDDVGWSDELADPDGGSLLCHNDVCMENVVFRDGLAVALLDFASPGRPIYDLAQFARMCVPMDADENTVLLGWRSVDKVDRLRLVADAYGLEHQGRQLLLNIVASSMGGIGPFVQRRLDAGDENFIKMWENMGGAERFTRRREWFSTWHAKFEVAMS